MNSILSNLADKCSNLLASHPGPEGRNKVAELLCEVISDPANVDSLIPPTTGEREVLYQDPDQGFCILAHQYNGPKSSPPHDHGPTWAIYAQARGETEMIDYELLSAASKDKAGKLKPLRTYMLRPGDAHVYEPGALHSPRRSAATSLLRVEGIDMSQVNRLRFEVE